MGRKINFSKSIISILILFYAVIPVKSQNLSPIKEEFDLLNAQLVNNRNPCELSPNDDGSDFGDGMSYILDGYISMYKSTGDKAYLYKFIIQSLCMMENRHDYAGINSEPRWSEYLYHDGYIIGAMARFVYFISQEDIYLQTVPIYPFPEISGNSFGETFSTFQQFANWLGFRVNETLSWYESNGYWNNSLGYKEFPDNSYAAPINYQVGFGRALLFMGLSNPNAYHLQKALTLANLFKGHVVFHDPCEDIFYNEPVFRLTANNAYWWYHMGWTVQTYNCWSWSYFHNVPEYNKYTEFKEDISHGAVDMFLVRDFFDFQPSTPFNSSDMVRFRNMFAKNIYDGSGGFYEAVDGTNNPVYPQYQLDISALNYMPFEKYDGYDNTATSPNVYDIIIEYYNNNITNNNALPTSYGGLANKGHAEVVQAQWEKECVNLTLYNRDVVYDQDFKVKNTLTIDPNDGPGTSYAEPITSVLEFTVESGTTVNFVAGESIVLKPGTYIKAGSNTTASIDLSNCTDGERVENNFGKKSIPNSSNRFIDSYLGDSLKFNVNKNSNNKSENDLLVLNASPNPFNNEIVLNFILSKPSSISIIISDRYGKIVYDQIKDRQVESGIYNIPIPTENFPSGVYHCVLIIDNYKLLTTNLIKTE